MVASVDPTYPLYTIASVLAAAMLLLVFLTSFIRQSWNLGLAFLCFWLFFENLTNGVNAIIWSDNADLKLFGYCDIVTHLQVATFVVKPMATLIITRRLHMITSQRSVELPNEIARRRNTVIEWTLGLVIPSIVAGPLYYVVQQLRFQVIEGTGCGNSQDGSILDILLIWSWSVIPPLISVTIYYPRVAHLFYHQSRHINRYLQSNTSVSRTAYFRILAFASIDILLTLPIGIVSIVLVVAASASQASLIFYPGWAYDHTNWDPESYPYSLEVAPGVRAVAQLYFNQWTSPVLAFVIFGLFGVTSEARASYYRVIWKLCGWFGCEPTTRVQDIHPTPGDIESGEQPLDTLIIPEIRSQTGYIHTDVSSPQKSARDEEGHATREMDNGPDVDNEKEEKRIIGHTTNVEQRASSRVDVEGAMGAT